MQLTEATAQEMNVLALFNQSTYQQGLKVHSHEASPEDVAATKRLFEKGLITQLDGGYLTTLGKDAVEKLQDLLTILK
ncbi:TIGR02647 family protein [Bermanella sp. WJH001]|uniref:TIGR02647 family protein n=1 Tax=Bermanella sp. WJH001 TaxID=3048005 RepID=UPI0024BE2E1C|nr:TIGR02647 family protein [Bermanella sp. WJH001]MDJ1538203.1 TIGR02647 family protein [Bermanella sp. WJH001]